jgi:hypothetical protein
MIFSTCLEFKEGFDLRLFAYQTLTDWRSHGGIKSTINRQKTASSFCFFVYFCLLVMGW